jgi:hypothetical protein
MLLVPKSRLAYRVQSWGRCGEAIPETSRKRLSVDGADLESRYLLLIIPSTSTSLTLWVQIIGQRAGGQPRLSGHRDGVASSVHACSFLAMV